MNCVSSRLTPTMANSAVTSYRFGLRVREQGETVSFADGVAWVRGLPSAAIDQLLTFDDPGATRALVFHLREELLGAIVLDAGTKIGAGTRVFPAARSLAIPVGDALLGRVVDPLCRPLDGGDSPKCESFSNIDILSPSIAQRDFVHDPMLWGINVIDTLLPIGRGQRQLIIGDHGTGKSALAIDCVVNQRPGDVYCVYVLIGQKRSDVVGVIDTLRNQNVLRNSVIVVAEADAALGLQYLAPFSGCAIAEHWMREGRHTLVVYDELTCHAQAYRALSLLLRRPPGREAYPGDIFFLHSRLLERATCLAPNLGGGSLTALPIIETEEGEIATYIPTNLISITDGQIYLSTELFEGGVLPAIDVAKSVSRIGGRAQPERIRVETGRARLDYLQYFELESFSRLGMRLEPATEAKIHRGRVLREVFKQERLAPRTPEFNMAWLVAFNDGLLDNIAPADVPQRLKLFEERVKTERITLTADRGSWSDRVRSWLGASN
jgi:F-type H+/Na+-transporting ATPase subunit alpha